MKKVYERPVLRTELFDTADVITASDAGNSIQNVGGGKFNMEVLGDAFAGVLDGLLGGNP